MTVRVYSDQAGTTAAAANDNIGKVEDLSKFNSDGVSSTTGPYLSVDANGFGSADILAQGGDVVQTFTNAIADGSALVVGTSKCIFFNNVNVEAGGTLTIGPAGDMINTNGLNLIGKVVSVATTTKVLTTAEQNSIATFFAQRGASSVVVNDETVYDENGVEADVVLDFTGDSFYRNVPHYFKLGGTYTTFADAFTGTSPKLTYSTTSNSTMTQGYGPELVTNGGFDTDSGWTTNVNGSGHSITGGQLVMSSASNVTATYRDIDIIGGGAYSVTVDVASVSSGALRVLAYGSSANEVVITPNISTAGVHVFDLPADDPGSAYLGKVVVQTAASGTSAVINSISVREAPKIVWAPHNLLTYSEDFTNAAWSKLNGASVTSDLVLAPDGTVTANTFVFDGSADGRVEQNTPLTAGLPETTVGVWLRVASGTQAALIGLTSGTVQSVTVTDQWQLFTAPHTAGGQYWRVRCDNAATIYAWGAHVYRSDLGGMAQVPGAATGFEYYVPTSGNAEYLPRVGHHVYNGSTWVNEGLLIESEARTNLFPVSTITAVGSGTDWDGNLSGTGSSVSVAAGVASPDGTTGAVGNFVADASATIAYFAKDVPVTYNVTYTQSVYAKPNGTNFLQIAPSTGFASAHYNFDLVNLETSSSDASIEDAGNGWVRCSVTATCTSTTSIGRMVFGWINSFTAPRLDSDAGGAPNGTDGVYLWGAQLEAGSTPSSYMPTNGGTYTRTAQSLEVPPAEFGWPEPEYIGPELVDNGDFSLGDNGDWNKSTGWSIGSGVASCDGTQSGASNLTQAGLPVTSGGVYALTVTCTARTAGTFRITGVNITGGDSSSRSTTGTFSRLVVATSSSIDMVVQGDANFVGNIDNISVREINPLAVSIQMDGRMTYADNNVGFAGASAASEVVPYDWRLSGTDYIMTGLETDISPHRLWFVSEQNNVPDLVYSEALNSPGVLTPFNIASRHGSTFVNGATDGTALTADTTPTALPDLSGTNLQIAHDFMGTIGTFRQFAGDIGDTGLVTATNPSTEPTLSLTFDGTAGGSYYNLSWSE